MNIIKQEHSYLYETPEGFSAGFTSSSVEGILEAKTLYSPNAYMRQVHGGEVRSEAQEAEQEADGIFSSKEGLYLFVKTADCLPLLLWSAEEKIVGAVHMGWRSAAANILNNIPFDLEHFFVIAGPGLRKCCYEVGEDVYSQERLKPYCSHKDGSAHFDPIAFAKDALCAKGLKEEHLFDADICTACSAGGLPSFRKDKTEKRTVSFICRR